MAQSRGQARKDVKSGGVYVNSKRVDNEQQKLNSEDLIFNKEWICVGRETEIPKVGDYFTYQLGKQPIIILRDRSKKIKAISNSKIFCGFFNFRS